MQPHKAFSSSIGSKFLIALTGLFLLIFLIGHLAGNLLFIAGPDAFNHYSHNLTSNPLVYVAEIGLVVLFVLHIFKTVGLISSSYAARPERYATKKWAKTNPGSRWVNSPQMSPPPAATNGARRSPTISRIVGSNAAIFSGLK